MRSPRGEAFGERDDGLQVRVGDVAAAHGQAIPGRVVCAVHLRQVFAREGVVSRLVIGNPIGMLLAEEGLGQRFACFRIHLEPLDGQPLLAFAAVGIHLVLRKNGPEQDAFGHFERRQEELGQGAEAQVNIVAIDVHVVVGAVKIEFFGDLLRVHVPAALAQQVGCRRGRKGDALHGGAGAEYETQAQHLELVVGQRVQLDAVAKRLSAGHRHVEPVGSTQGRLFHRLARYKRVELFSGRNVRRLKAAISWGVTAW